MGLVPFALSIHQLVSSVGADVGFAAMVGLAILVLLYFAQARETANLREQAYEAAQRVEQLEARIAQVARRQTASPAAPVGATPAGAAVAVSRVVPSAVAGARAQGVSGPPAGVAAPALASATRLIGDAAVAEAAPVIAGSDGAGPIPAAPPASPGVPASAPAAVAVAAGVPAAAAVGTAPPGATPGSRPGLHPGARPGALAGSPPDPGAGGRPDAAPGGPPPTGGEGPEVSGEEPADVSASAVVPLEPTSDVTAIAGSAYEEPGGVPPATFAGAGNGATGGYAPPAGADRTSPRPVERPRARQLAPRRPAPGPQAVRRRSRVGLLVALLAGAAVAGGVLVVLLIMTNKSSPAAGAASHKPPTGAHAGGTLGFNPSKVTVAVLNGTAVNGLAMRTAARLKALGYKEGTIATASNQTYTSTIVAYFTGHRADAVRVARALKLKPKAIQAVDSSTQAVACPQSPCTATVVVTTGADIASQ